MATWNEFTEWLNTKVQPSALTRLIKAYNMAEEAGDYDSMKDIALQIIYIERQEKV